MHDLGCMSVVVTLIYTAIFLIGAFQEIFFMTMFEVDVGGNAGRGRPRQTFVDQLVEVFEKGQVKSTRNRRASIWNLMTVKEA
jgi:hypothetical protein